MSTRAIPPWFVTIDEEVSEFQNDGDPVMKTSIFQTYEDLLHQGEILQEISHDVNPAIVDMIQVAIAEDILFFEMISNQENRKQLLDQYIAGELELKSGTIEAARILVNLILGEPT
jgi:hypothetical protein